MNTITIRQLMDGDEDRGLLETLDSLSPACRNPLKNVLAIARRSFGVGNHVKTFVAVDDIGMVVGTASVIIEQKLIHDCGWAAHIEDVAVRSDCKGGGIGKALIQMCVAYCQSIGCYKVVLNCSPGGNVQFYEKCGFKQTPDVFMRLDLEETK